MKSRRSGVFLPMMKSSTLATSPRFLTATGNRRIPSPMNCPNSFGLISPKEFGQFIGEGIRLSTVTVKNLGEVAKVLDFIMGKNTPERRDFIIDNLVTDVV